MADGVVEVITGRERRRRWSMEEKLRIVAETFEPGASVGQIAARHDVYPGQLFTWRRQARSGKLTPSREYHAGTLDQEGGTQSRQRVILRGHGADGSSFAMP